MINSSVHRCVGTICRVTGVTVENVESHHFPTSKPPAKQLRSVSVTRPDRRLREDERTSDYMQGSTGLYADDVLVSSMCQNKPTRAVTGCYWVLLVLLGATGSPLYDAAAFSRSGCRHLHQDFHQLVSISSTSPPPSGLQVVTK